MGTLHFGNRELIFCICIPSVRCSCCGYLPSLPPATNADVDLSAVYADTSQRQNKWNNGRC